MEEHDAVAAMRRGDINGLARIVRVYQVKAVRTAEQRAAIVQCYYLDMTVIVLLMVSTG